MAAGRLLLPGWMPAVDGNGDPIPNAKVYFYYNKTTTLAPVFADEALSLQIANPVEANATGRFPAVWADGEILYSAAVEAPYGPAGVPFSYDNLSASLAAEIVLTEAAEAAADDAEIAYQNILDAIQAAQDADGDAAVAGAIAGQAAGTAAANVVVAGKANIDLANVPANTFMGKTGTIQQYIMQDLERTPVARPLDQRFQVRLSDYGVRLYQSGNSGPLQDNTAAIQQAIDDAQARNGVIIVDNFGAMFGSSVVLTGPLTLRSGVFNGIDYTAKGVAIIGEDQGDRAAWQHGRYDIGQGFKLIAGSTEPLIKSPDGAGILVMEDLILAGDGNNARGVELTDRGGGATWYSFGAHMKHVYINGFGRCGFYAGAGRGRGTTEWVWVEYCGTTSSEAAWAQLAYDWENYSVGIGVNTNTGLYVGNGSQVRFIGGASWMNDIGCVVDGSCMDVDFIGFHFDNAFKSNLVVNGHTNYSTRMGGRRFVSCKFSTASEDGNNLYPAIGLVGVRDGDSIFTAPDFMGGHGAETYLPSYLVEADATSIFRTDSFVYNTDTQKPYATAPINDWNRIRLGGTVSASIGMNSAGTGVAIRSGNTVLASFTTAGSFIGGSDYGQTPFAALAVNGTDNYVVAKSTAAGDGYASIEAASTQANADLLFFSKGTGRVRFGTHTASTLTPTGHIEIKDAAGTIRRLLVG